MLTPTEIQSRLERVLLRVQKPGRYVGGELNQIVKDWDSVETRVALAFPDIYDLGLPNLGLAILYHTLNARPDVLAERAFVPWIDMEEQLRQQRDPTVFPGNQARPGAISISWGSPCRTKRCTPTRSTFWTWPESRSFRATADRQPIHWSSPAGMRPLTRNPCTPSSMPL